MDSARRALYAALLLVLIASARIVSTYTVFNHTIDEPDHLAAGMEYLSTGKYLYEDQHPPLARVFGAIGPFLHGERFHAVRGPGAYGEGYRILGWDEHYDRTLALGRAGILPFFWIGAAVVFLWGLRAAGPWAALLATFLFTTLPPVLAHAGLITTDMAAAALTAAACYGSLLWADRPDRQRTIWFGVVLGVAALTKFSAIPYTGAALLLMHRGALWRHRRPLAAALGIAFLVIWAGYAFSFARVDYLHLRLPAPRFFTGLQTLWAHNAAGHPSYLFGRRSPAGFWYYYPAALAVKTPLALLLLLPLALRRAARQPLLYALAILAVASLSRINIGTRHVLPIYAGLVVACAAGAAPLLARPVARWMILALLVWQAASGALQHPDYLAYTNELAGSHPENFLADSDLDWGQDMKRLGDFLAQQHATSFTFVPFNRTYATLCGHALPPMQTGAASSPSPGWNAVSVSVWKIFGLPTWPTDQPDVKIGRSIFLWNEAGGYSAAHTSPEGNSSPKIRPSACSSCVSPSRTAISRSDFGRLPSLRLTASRVGPGRSRVGSPVSRPMAASASPAASIFSSASTQRVTVAGATTRLPGP